MSVSDAQTLDDVFRALGDGTRRAIFETLGRQPGATTSQLVVTVPHLSRWAVMKHLQVLRDAGLVQSLPRGRQRCHFRVERTLDEAVAWLAHEAGRTTQDGTT